MSIPCTQEAIRLFGTDAQPRAAVPTWLVVMHVCVVLAAIGLSVPLTSCSHSPEPDTLVMIIESSPTNLDPRVGLDAQSERIDGLLFDDLLTRDEHFNVQPGLAERWEIPDPLTYIFHLHKGVKFHDGRPLTSRDVKWSFDSLLQGKIRSTKAATYPLCGSHRRARRLHGNFSFEGAVRGAAVERVRGGDGDCALRQRRRNEPASRRVGAVSLCKRGAG